MAKNRTKLIRYILNHIGYDIRRLQKTYIHAENPGYLYAHDRGFDGFETIIPRPVDSLDILFRCCAGVEIFGQSRKRLGNSTKPDLLLRSLNSIIKSITHARRQGLETKIKLTCLDDHSAEPVVNNIKELLTRAECDTEFVALEVTGNGASEGQVLRWAKEKAKGLIYFVEDDYLHEEKAILEIVMSYERLTALFEKDIVLYPADESNHYRHIFETQVFLGSHRHWRSVPSTTFTFITVSSVLRKYWDRFIALEQYGSNPDITEATTINSIYKEVPCLSPMPSLAVHYQQIDTLPPYIDWKQWWENAATDIHH